VAFAIENYEQSFIYDITAYLGQLVLQSWGQQTKQHCVSLLSADPLTCSSTFLAAQNTAVTNSLTSNCLAPPTLNKPTASSAFSSTIGVTRGLNKGWKLKWMGPASRQSEKSWKMIVNLDVDVYTKHRNHRKTLRKMQKKQPTENHKNTKSRFFHLACRFAPTSPSLTPKYSTYPFQKFQRPSFDLKTEFGHETR